MGLRVSPSGASAIDISTARPKCTLWSAVTSDKVMALFSTLTGIGVGCALGDVLLAFDAYSSAKDLHKSVQSEIPGVAQDTAEKVRELASQLVKNERIHLAKALCNFGKMLCVTIGLGLVVATIVLLAIGGGGLPFVAASLGFMAFIYFFGAYALQDEQDHLIKDEDCKEVTYTFNKSALSSLPEEMQRQLWISSRNSLIFQLFDKPEDIELKPVVDSGN